MKLSGEVNTNVVGYRQIPVLRELIEAILLEVLEAVKEIKSGKAPGLLPMECLKKGDIAVLDC